MSAVLASTGALLILSVPGVAIAQHAATRAAAAETSPVLQGKGTGSVSFYYGGTTNIATSTPAQLQRLLGKPTIVVTKPGAQPGSEAATAASIHKMTGAPRAYRYAQFFWAPADSTYEGIDLADHPQWAFCTQPAKPGQQPPPAVGRNVGNTAWDFLDLNKVKLRSQVLKQLQQFKAEGWDGVMFDRGAAATTGARDTKGLNVWDAVSTCQGHDQLYDKKATFADSYVNMVALAHTAGLKVLFNNGTSPFGQVRMRPNPRDVNCQLRKWAECTFLGDLWPAVDLVLNESVARPRDIDWKADFVANKRSETDAAHGHRVVGLLTTATLGSAAAANSRANVYYEWARVRLFNLAIGVSTGDGGCDGATGPCNHNGTYPELATLRLGAPLTRSPKSTACKKHDKVHCVWSRQYAAGMDVVNVSHKRHKVTLKLKTGSCRYVQNMLTGKPVASDHCVSKVKLKLAGWTGYPLRYSTRRW